MEKLSLRTLEVQEMEKIEGGSCSYAGIIGGGIIAIGVTVFSGGMAGAAAMFGWAAYMQSC